VPRVASPRRVKLHRNYSVEEAARYVAVHKNTVRRWIKDPSIVGGSSVKKFPTFTLSGLGSTNSPR